MSAKHACYESPSNIAIVKYWGKKARQIPLNPSVSFTLSKSKSITKVDFHPHTQFELDFLFSGTPNEKFKEKIVKKLLTLKDFFPWLETAYLKISSENTFPHSAGIASSASSMSALSLCLVDIDYQLNNKKIHDEEFYKLASNVARILSGSACRSIFKTAATYGVSDSLNGSSDEIAKGLDHLMHENFRTLYDAIMIVDSGEKSVSSSVGHELMNQHVHRESRIKHANKNFTEILAVFKNGDFKRFSEISEIEAMDLHAMMMTSSPSFILLRPESLLIIEEIKKFRELTKAEITFTIDAGPNIHILYTKKDKLEVEEFIKNKFVATKIVSNVIFDQVGDGASKLS